MMGKMKNKFNILLSLAILAILGVSCDPSEVTYSDKEYVMFEDSVLTCPVTQNVDTTFNIFISSTVACDHDRNYAVRILEHQSNAIEGYHYTLESPNVTIKKGELAASLKLKANYNNFSSHDSLCVTLQLIAPDEEKLNLYSDKVNIQLVKCPPLDINLYTSNIRFYATFPFSESDVKSFYLKTEKISDTRLLLKSPFDDNHDLYIDFDYSDILAPTVVVPEQVAFTDGSYGEVYVRSSSTDYSYFYPDKEDRMIFMYLEFYLPSVGRFGTYEYLIQWVDDDTVSDSNNNIN